ncbi:MAG: hypothetical protein KAX78_09325 [Phycisphaerae bacterium]|nr:hypothetical protein [Phycisphaerae bacterium]
MSRTKVRREDWSCANGEAVILQEAAVEHLQNAFRQMDLLLRAQRVDAGLFHLVAMIRSLQALRRFIL